MPLGLFAALTVSGVWLDSVETGNQDVLLVGTLDGMQLGLLLLLIATASGTIALLQAIVLVGRLNWVPVRVLVRLIAGVLLAAAVPVGYLLLIAAAFAGSHGYRPLTVPGHTVVVRSFTWHHTSLDLLERDGMLFHPVALCGDPLPVDAYNAFSAGQYDIVSRGGRDVLRFAEGPVGPYTGEAVLGTRPGDDVSASCTAHERNKNPRSPGGFSLVGDTGIEPVTSSVSGKRATAAPIARA